MVTHSISQDGELVTGVYMQTFYNNVIVKEGFGN